jgi:peptidoglycan/xylan/chitin deacetylase (PgdA/CDA1 family)
MKDYRRTIKIGSYLLAIVGLFCFSNLKISSAASSTPVFSERLPILMYHYVEIPPATTTLPNLYMKPEVFENQLQEMKKLGYSTIFMSVVATSLNKEKSLPKKSIALTFDDGYRDFYTNVFPLLKKYQIKATVYVIINALGQNNYLTKDQTKEMASSGLVEIGSHTFNHLDLRKLKKKDAVFEINYSRQALAKISGQSIMTFAYPFGYYDSRALDIVHSAGYSAAVSVKSGLIQSKNNIFLLNRVRVNNLLGQKFGQWLEHLSGSVK